MTSKETSLLSRKEKLEEDLRAVQKQIYELEEAYLMEHVYGNIVKGWDTFATSSETRPNTSRKTKIGDRDRIFSQSSVKFSPEAEFGGDQDDHDDDDDDMLEDGRYRKSRSGRGQYYD